MELKNYSDDILDIMMKHKVLCVCDDDSVNKPELPVV